MSAKVEQFQTVSVNVDNVVVFVEEIKSLVDLSGLANQVQEWWVSGTVKNQAYETAKWSTVQKYHHIL